jgi:sugar phosphate isomerase/epimerase
MKLGLVSAILPQYSLEKIAKTASDIGYEALEVCCWPFGKANRRYAGITHIDVATMDDAKTTEIQKLMVDNQLDISSLGYYPNPLDPDKEKRDAYIAHLYKLIDASKKLGTNRITTFIGKDKTQSIEDNMALFKVIWEPIIKYAQSQNVEIGIENCQMYFSKDEWPGGNNLASTPAIWRKMFEMFPQECFGLNYDPSHPYWMQMDYIKPIYEFAGRIKHVHIKDARVYQDKLDEHGIYGYPLDFHSPKLPGLGGVNWGSFLSALNDIRYDGYACIEVEDKAYEATEQDVLRAVKQSYTFIRNFIF